MGVEDDMGFVQVDWLDEVRFNSVAVHWLPWSRRLRDGMLSFRLTVRAIVTLRALTVGDGSGKLYLIDDSLRKRGGGGSDMRS